jgi:cell division protein FtsB
VAGPLWWRRVRQHFGISAPQMAVRTRLPRWGLVAILASTFVVIATLAWWIDVGTLMSGFNRRDIEAKVIELEADAERLRAEASRLRERNSRLDSELAMTKGAQDALTRQINDLSGENTQLKEELAFLQRLFADSSRQAGLSIPRMTLERESDEVWRYNLLVVRGGPQTNDFEGRVGLLAIVIPPGGPPRTLSIPEDQPDVARTLALKFQYYQRLEGALRVPVGAQVMALTARVYDASGGSPRATRTLTNP